MVGHKHVRLHGTLHVQCKVLHKVNLTPQSGDDNFCPFSCKSTTLTTVLFDVLEYEKLSEGWEPPCSAKLEMSINVLGGFCLAQS